MNALYSLSLKLIGAEAVNVQSQLGSPKNANLWNILGDFFVALLPWLANLGSKLVYVICRFILNIVDFMQYFCKKLVGLDYWGTDRVNINTLGESDIIFRFLYNDGVQKVFKYMLGIFVVLLIVFTIIAIVKNEYSYMTSDDEKASNDKMGVFKRSMRAIALVILLPIMIVMGILASNAILTSLVNAFNLNNNLTMGGQVFVASAYDANKFRAYANNGIRFPATNGVAVSEQINGNGEMTTYVVRSTLTTLSPVDYHKNNKFVGFMFRYNGKDYLYHTAEAGESYSVAMANLQQYYKHYEYFLRECLGATLIKPGAVGKSTCGYGDYAFTCSLHALEKTDRITQAAYNTWNFNNLQRLEEYTFAETVSVDTIEPSWNGFVGVKKYTNSPGYGGLHDGGAEGLVAIADEYLVMADLIDYLITEAVEVSYINVRSPLIKWDYNGNGKYLDSRYKPEGSHEFMVAYKNTGYVAYNPKDEHEEQMGAIYTMAYYNAVEGKYVPIVNNGTYTDQYGNDHTFKSENLHDDYQGIIVARGILESTYHRSSGTPTQIKDVYQTSVSGDDVSLNDPYYAKMTIGDEITVGAKNETTKNDSLSVRSGLTGDNFEEKALNGEVLSESGFVIEGNVYLNSNGSYEASFKKLEGGLYVYADVTFNPKTSESTLMVYDIINISINNVPLFSVSSYNAKKVSSSLYIDPPIENYDLYTVSGPTQWYNFGMRRSGNGFEAGGTYTMTEITLSKYSLFAFKNQSGDIREYQGKDDNGNHIYKNESPLETRKYVVDLKKDVIIDEGQKNYSLMLYAEDGYDTVIGQFYYRLGEGEGPLQNDVDNKKFIIQNANTFVLGVETLYSIPVHNNPNEYFDSASNRIVFERHSVSSSTKGDFSLNVLSIFGEGPTFRCKIGLFNCASDNKVNKSALKLENGSIFLDYNFNSDPALTLETFFVPSRLNILVLVFATILIFIVLGQAVWGMIARIYDITLYFVVMPGVLGAMPLDNGSMFNKWKEALIPKVLGAYGVMIGLNFFFILIPAIREGSQLFTDFDLQTNLSQGSWLAGISASAVNQLVYIMFLLVAFTLIKTLPQTIAGLLKAGDVYGEGGSVRDNVNKTVNEVGSHVSGKKALDTVNSVIGTKGSDGKRHGGLLQNFTPGSAIYDAWKKNKKEKEDASAAEETAAASERARAAAEAKMNEGSEKYESVAEDKAEETAEETAEGVIENHEPETVPISEEVIEGAIADEVEEATEPSAAVENVSDDLEALGVLADQSKTGNDFANIGESFLQGDENLANIEAGMKENLVDGLNVADSVEFYESLQSENNDSIANIDKQIADKKAQMTEWFEAGQKSGRAKNGDDYVISNGSKEDYELGLPSQKQISDTRDEIKELEAKRAGLVAQSSDAQQKQDALIEGWAQRDNYLDGLVDNKLAEETEEVKEEAKEESKHAEESDHAKVADQLAEGAVVPQAESADKLKGGLDTKATEDAKKYTEAAKSFAGAAKIYADVAGGKVDQWKESKKEKTRDEKELERLEAKRDKLLQDQADGKAHMALWNPLNRSKAYEEFNERNKDDIANQIIDPKNKELREKLAVDLWNEKNKDDASKQLTYDQLKDSKYSKQIMEDFNNKQSQLKAQARNEFINNNIDNKINKVKERIALKEQGLYENWAQKGLRIGLGAIFGRKVTDEDRAKWAIKKAAAVERLEKAKRIATKAEATGNKAALKKAEKAIVQAQQEINRRNAQINRNVMGFVPFVAKSVAKDLPKWIGGGALTLGKKGAKKVAEAIHDNMPFMRKLDKELIANKGYTNIQMRALNNKKSAMSAAEIDLRNYIRKNRNKLNINEKVLTIDEIRDKLNNVTNNNLRKEAFAKFNAFSDAKKQYDLVKLGFDRMNRNSYVRANTIMQRRERDKVMAQRSVLIDELNKKRKNGTLTPREEARLIANINGADTRLQELKNVPPRFKAVRNIANAIAKWPITQVNAIKGGLTRFGNWNKEFKQTNTGKTIAGGIRIGAGVLTGIMAGPIAGAAVVFGNKIIKHNRNLKAARIKLATPEQLAKRDQDIKASIVKGQKNTEEKIRGIQETRLSGQDARNLINEKGYVDKVKNALLKAGFATEASKFNKGTTAEQAKTALTTAIEKLTNDRTTINKAIKEAMKDPSVGIKKAAEEVTAKQIQRTAINSQLRALRGVNKITIDSGNVTVKQGAKVVTSGNVKPDSAAVESVLRTSLKNDLNKILKKPIKEALNAGYKPTTAKSAGKAFDSVSEYNALLNKLYKQLDTKMKNKKATTADVEKFKKIESELTRIKNLNAKYEARAKKMGKDISKILRDKRVKYKVPHIADTRDPNPKGK